MKKSMYFVVGTLIGTVLLLFVLGGMTMVIDPLFHYHVPLQSLQYPLNNQRYQNDGILRHFDYDSIIIGTSMSENFKASEFDALFGANSVKTCLSGASYKEQNERLSTALQTHPDTRFVVRELYYGMLLQDKDQMRYDSYPDYLYDDNLLNDVSYLFNKEILCNQTLNVLRYTRNGNTTPSFDEYSNWMAGKTFGPDALAQNYKRTAKTKRDTKPFSDKDREIVRENLEQNVISTIKAYPDTQFYIFFSPFSICYFDSLNLSGNLVRKLEVEKFAIELLLPYENVHLFSFFDDFEMICDLNNYKDLEHYGDWINSQILVWMKNGEHLLTPENYLDYCAREQEFYLNFDYDSFFEKIF